MYPLIEITTIPIEIEIKTTRAKLAPTKASAEVEITRDKSGGMSIKSRPIKINLDTFEARNEILPSLTRKAEQSSVNGMQPSYEATATYAQQGQLLLNAKVGEELIAKYAINETFSGITPAPAPVNPGIKFIADQPSKTDWGVDELHIRYEMDKLNFDWRTNQHPSFEFTPGDIQLTITQRPEIVIKYVGGPIYVPPSSDPNYEPVDVQA